VGGALCHGAAVSRDCDLTSFEAHGSTATASTATGKNSFWDAMIACSRSFTTEALACLVTSKAWRGDCEECSPDCEECSAGSSTKSGTRELIAVNILASLRPASCHKVPSSNHLKTSTTRERCKKERSAKSMRNSRYLLLGSVLSSMHCSCGSDPFLTRMTALRKASKATNDPSRSSAVKPSA